MSTMPARRLDLVLTRIEPREADRLLDTWALRPARPPLRPARRQAWLLGARGRACAVAVSAAPAATTTAGHPAARLVQLAAFAADPEQGWALAAALRLWRERAVPRWPGWPVAAAVAYPPDAQHAEALRRDGWTRQASRALPGLHPPSRTDEAATGRLAPALWVYRYPHQPQPPTAPRPAAARPHLPPRPARRPLRPFVSPSWRCDRRAR